MNGLEQVSEFALITMCSMHEICINRSISLPSCQLTISQQILMELLYKNITIKVLIHNLSQNIKDLINLNL